MSMLLRLPQLPKRSFDFRALFRTDKGESPRDSWIIPAAIVLSLSIFSPNTPAATINASSCSQSDVQNAVNSAATGDTVNVPGGSCSWSSGVSIPSSKGITVNGGGTTTINGGFNLNAGSSPSRVTGFALSIDSSFVTSGSPGTAPFRIDHNTFTSGGGPTFIWAYGNAPGLVDHNTFTTSSNAEMIHNMGMGANDASGWTASITPGSYVALYVEANTFTYKASGNPAYYFGSSAMQSYYGAVTVFRYNTCNMCQIDQHGTPGMIGARWWEIYENTFATTVANASQSSYIVVRGGSGVIFNNHHTGTNCGDNSCGNIELYEEDSGSWPVAYQVGSGINGGSNGHSTCGSTNSSPAYVWGNDSSMPVSPDGGEVKMNRDVFSSSSQPASMMRQQKTGDSCSTTYSYVPFTYPYPLSASGLPSPSGGGTTTTDSTPPSTPTGLVATAMSVSKVNLSWNASTDGGSGVAGYNVFRNGAKVATTTATNYSDSGLLAATLYTYTVSASDSSGNTSAVSIAAIATTLSVIITGDTQAPSAPSGLGASAVSSTQINLTWNASTDNVGVSGYRISRNGSQVGTSAVASYTDIGLTPSTSYSYTVSAFDAAGNVSGQSGSASATTQAPASQGQTTTGFIPTTRTIDWTHAGIPGGIPSANWPIYKTLSPSGGADDSVAIQTALNAAPAGSVVLLNPGTYKLHRSSMVCSGYSDDGGGGTNEAGLCISRKVVLRGSGPGQTILNYGDGANVISLGTTYLATGNTVFKKINSGATKGSTQIVVASAAGISAGTYITITQNNPTDSDGNPLVDTTGYTGSCSFCGHGFANNAMTQIDKVTAVSGTTLTLERPLYFDYTNVPQFYILSQQFVEFAGLENLRLLPTASSGTGIVYKNINLESCAYCWVHNVESDMAVDRANVYLSDVYASEISSNYLYDGFTHTSGEDYSIYLEYRDSENLIQNNIVRKGRHSTPLSGTSGNVFAYNYFLDDYMGEDTDYLADRNTHAAHPYMNLWEGNVGANMELDYAHGSSSHNTLYRNYVNLTALDPSGVPMDTGLFAINIAYFNNYENVVGNVIGQYGSTCTAKKYEINADGSQSPSIYKLGYYDDGGTASPNPSLSAKVGQTILRGGNWDCVSNTVVWNSNVPSGSLVSSYLSSQSLPISLYLASKPSWFTAAGAAWPPIDPSASTKVNKIPAQLCYESGPKAGGAFNPSACYASGTTTQAPAPPTNLTTSVQ